jgi:membrane-bound lytic murein transglycosylase A
LRRAARTDFRFLLALSAALIVLAACESAPPGSASPAASRPATTAPSSSPSIPDFRLAVAEFSDLPGWAADDLGPALAAFRRSCRVLARKPAGETLGRAGSAGTAGQWAETCAAAPDSPAAARDYFESRFRPYRVLADGAGLFTGYFEPEYAGSLTPSAVYPAPLYALPPGDGIGPSRAEIEAGALAGRGLEWLWLADPVDAFFLHVQGSGRVRLDDGRVLRVGYAGNNGRDYVAIGRILIDRGAIPRDEISMQSIRAWLAANPAEAQAVMNANPRYIYFRAVEGEGPIGAQGVALEPGRSLAVDPAFLPYGAPLWLDSADPDGRPLRRLVIAQDTGGAIRGAVRGDLFWGAGPEAAAMAGRMNARGGYTILLPRTVSPAQVLAAR